MDTDLTETNRSAKPPFLEFREVLVTGGTGFIGQRVCRALVGRGWLPRLLVRPGSEGKIPADLAGRVRVTPGDATDPDFVLNAAQSTDAIVHLVGIIREEPGKGIDFGRLHVDATRNVIAAAKTWGIRRLVHVSALGADPHSPVKYLSTKGEAEERVRASGLDWTVFRPSIVFGDGDRFLSSLREAVATRPFVPVPGDGRYELSPVWVGNVARGIAESLRRPETIGRTFDVGGPERFRYDALLDRIGGRVGAAPVRKVFVPLRTARKWVGVLSRFERFPVSPAMLELLVGSFPCDSAPFREAFGERMLPLSTYLGCTAEMDGPAGAEGIRPAA